MGWYFLVYLSMYSASLIAYAFVRRGIEDRNPITQMKLQKVVYFAEGLHLATYDKELIKENFQAWKYGPVIPIIYRDYKLYASSPIMDTESMWFINEKDTDLSLLDSNAEKIINDTWDSLQNVPTSQLSNWTHKDGSPWANHYIEGVPDIIIPKDDIKEYFRSFNIQS